MRSGSRSCNFRFWLTALAGYIKKHRNLITHFDFGQKLLESALFASICSMARNQNESKKKKKRPGKLKSNQQTKNAHRSGREVIDRTQINWTTWKKTTFVPKCPHSGLSCLLSFAFARDLELQKTHVTLQTSYYESNMSKAQNDKTEFYILMKIMKPRNRPGRDRFCQINR